MVPDQGGARKHPDESTLCLRILALYFICSVPVVNFSSGDSGCPSHGYCVWRRSSSTIVANNELRLHETLAFLHRQHELAMLVWREMSIFHHLPFSNLRGCYPFFHHSLVGSTSYVFTLDDTSPFDNKAQNSAVN